MGETGSAMSQDSDSLSSFACTGLHRENFSAVVLGYVLF